MCDSTVCMLFPNGSTVDVVPDKGMQLCKASCALTMVQTSDFSNTSNAPSQTDINLSHITTMHGTCGVQPGAQQRPADSACGAAQSPAYDVTQVAQCRSIMKKQEC